ncbi:MAG: gluconokinase [Paraglaciecola sp.]|uniref:gluconokinase n=1 Tax=Paraglaciecola sp. TaxID=1920173 RepID=UPI00273FBEE8|nr:gluconokinase [Paraglaciecola sp.]MDP5031260.1 gluconokinase [Paraglaciecola sp.]MDP5133131.1 gluconokinase [Paraglaciecola sp.]
MIVIVCGVSGTGKSTVGKLLAEALQLPFLDADDFHPQSNVQKMQQGIALDDKDRQPWLETIAIELAAWESLSGGVLACSALKASYRETLRSKCKKEIRWIILHGSTELLTQRLSSRQGHFFDPRLLSSQLNTLEVSDDAWVIDVQSSPDEIVKTILQGLARN